MNQCPLPHTPEMASLSLKEVSEPRLVLRKGRVNPVQGLTTYVTLGEEMSSF